MALPDDLDPDLELAEPVTPYWEAFGVLATARTMGGAGMAPAPNPLAVSEILTLAMVRGLDVETALSVVQALDVTWLTWWREQVTTMRGQETTQEAR